MRVTGGPPQRHALVAVRLEVMLYVHCVQLPLACIDDEGGVDVTLRQLCLGDPFFCTM